MLVFYLPGSDSVLIPSQPGTLSLSSCPPVFLSLYFILLHRFLVIDPSCGGHLTVSRKVYQVDWKYTEPISTTSTSGSHTSCHFWRFMQACVGLEYDSDRVCCLGSVSGG